MKLADTTEKDTTKALLLAELAYCAEHEMITELSDFLIRRTGRLYFEKALADKYAVELNEGLAVLLNLSIEDSDKSLQTYMAESEGVLSFTN